MTSYWLKPFSEIYNFILWWIVLIPAKILRSIKSFLITLDNILELGANLRLWFAVEPLFGDYTWAGRLTGLVLRTVRVLATVILYFIVVIIGMFLTVGWLLVPVYIFVLIF